MERKWVFQRGQTAIWAFILLVFSFCLYSLSGHIHASVMEYSVLCGSSTENDALWSWSPVVVERTAFWHDWLKLNAPAPVFPLSISPSSLTNLTLPGGTFLYCMVKVNGGTVNGIIPFLH